MTDLRLASNAIAGNGNGIAAARKQAPVKLAARGLDFYYGKDQALHGIDLEVPEKKVTALIGPSGCGKSTLLRVFNRIYSLYRLRSKVGMVFQKPVPFPMSIWDNVAYGIKHHESLSKADLSERVELALRQAALWDEVKDKLKNSGLGLSGGQQQRLCIARAIALRPQVLLFDEPTSALDPIATGKIEQLFAELKQQFTILIVTHNMQQAARCSDYTAFMYLGELIEHGATGTIFTKPSKQQTEDYITGRFG